MSGATECGEDRRTETDFAVADLRAEKCACCARNDRCRNGMVWGLYREVPEVWDFRDDGSLVCIEYQSGGERGDDTDGDQT